MVVEKVSQSQQLRWGWDHVETSRPTSGSQRICKTEWLTTSPGLMLGGCSLLAWGHISHDPGTMIQRWWKAVHPHESKIDQSFLSIFQLHVPLFGCSILKMGFLPAMVPSSSGLITIFTSCNLLPNRAQHSPRTKPRWAHAWTCHYALDSGTYGTVMVGPVPT